MGGKHLKRLRAEKAKVHLKKKKLLPKGQNVTDTSFKAKKIVMIEQLKKVDENEPVTSWNLSLKELLVRVSHYNYSTRLNSLTGLRELITKHPQILVGPSLRNIIHKLLELVIDVEHKIRVTAINLINDIFSQLPSHYLAPFNDILYVHIGCSMTHREMSIQHDSLKLVDVAIRHAPDALKKNFPTLLKNFLRILSGYKYGHHSEVNFFKKSKQDVEKSKIEMLLKFYQLLDSVYTLESSKGDGGVRDVSSHMYRFDLKNLSNPYTKVPDLSSLFKTSSAAASNDTVPLDHSSEFQMQISDIMPLLFDTWAEFAPGQKADQFVSECLLSESVSQLLHIILEILLLLYEKAVETEGHQLRSWFVSNYGATFARAFMANFPYLPAVSISASDSQPGLEVNQSKNSTTYITQNLILCYLYYQFKAKHRSEELEAKIDKYLLDSLLLKNPPSVKILIKVIEVVLDDRKSVKLQDIITSVVKAYTVTTNAEYRKCLFGVLMKVALSDSGGGSQTSPNHHLNKWMMSLPDVLLERKVPLYVVETVSRIISREVGREVLRNIGSKAVAIARELSNTSVEGKETFEGQKLIANLLYWCPNVILEKVARESASWGEAYPKQLRDYITGIINFKLTNSKNSS